MSDLVRRLNATLRTDAINGDSFERSVVESQVAEAVRYIEELERQVARQAISTEEGGWVACSERLPDAEAVEVWAWVVPRHRELPFTPCAIRCKTYRHPIKGIRINCAAGHLPTHWQPYIDNTPTPPIQQQGRADSSLGEQKQDE